MTLQRTYCWEIGSEIFCKKLLLLSSEATDQSGNERAFQRMKETKTISLTSVATVETGVAEKCNDS